MWLLLIELAIRSILPPFYSFSYIERICKDKLLREPKRIDTLYFLGNLYIWYGKYKEAEYPLETLLQIKDRQGVRLLLSKVYFNLDRYDKVIDILNIPNVISPNDIENFYLGYSLIDIGKYRQGAVHLENYLKYHTHKEYSHFTRLGYAYFMSGEYSDALRCYRTAEQMNPHEKRIKESILLCIDKLHQGESSAKPNENGRNDPKPS